MLPSAPWVPYAPPSTMQVAVFNPGGRDAEQLFPDAAGTPDNRVHAPVNYHAYAACTSGGFFRDGTRIPEECQHVILLLRRDLKPAIKALRELKARGKVVAVSWKESGIHQIARQLDDASALALFREVCAQADAALSSTADLVPLYQEAGARAASFIPTPYPVDDFRWDFSRLLTERSGIFIGTREWDVPTRNHAAAMIRAVGLGVPVTVCNIDGRAGRKKLAALGSSNLRIIDGRLPYTEYLEEMSRSRLVFQRDASSVPGQVAGDALLCRMPCVGGNSAIEQLVFTGDGDIERLLRDDDAWRAAVEASQAHALAKVSYRAVAQRLADFFSSLSR
jgi:hypothetical protein